MNQDRIDARKIIYDIGANNGDDIPYYLMKGDLVVAIEANPILCNGIRERFSTELEAGRLVLESCVVTAGEESDEVDFYLHKTIHTRGQFPAPPEVALERFTKVRLPSKSILDIIGLYGNPYYIKIDIENYDAQVLKDLFSGGIYPPYVSAESHSLETFLTLATQGNYNAFKLVEGSTVPLVYADRLISCNLSHTNVQYSFPKHSAGPFGDDIDGEWMTADNFFRLLAFEGLGWKDIHATNINEPDPSFQPKVVNHLDRLIAFDELIFYIFRKIIRKMRRSLAIRLHRILDAFRTKNC